MTNTVTANVNNYEVTALDTGYFQVGDQKLSFADLIVYIGLKSLNAQDKTFETMFREAEERSDMMNKLNDCLQMLNKYKNYFNKDGEVSGAPSGVKYDDEMLKMTPDDMEKWKNDYLPALVDSGIVADSQGSSTNHLGIGSDGIFNKKELDTFLENAKLAQSNMSSMNEQQMMKTNQAATKRSTILQQLQTLLAASKDAMSAAAR